MSFIDDIAKKYDYGEEEKKIIKVAYDLFVNYYENQKRIEDVLENVPFFIKKEKGSVKALFARRIYKKDKKYATKSKIVIRKADVFNLNDLLDEVVYQYNEAINSYKNELTIEKDKVIVRRGIELKILSKSLKTEKIYNSLIEGAINSFQSEEILQRLTKQQNKLYNIKGNENYLKYQKERHFLKPILKSEDLMNIINNARIEGHIDSLEDKFYELTKVQNFFYKINNLLEENNLLETRYKSTKILKSFYNKKLKNNRLKINSLMNKLGQEVKYEKSN